MSPATATAATVGPEFFRHDMPLDQLQPSPLNPRKHFDETRLRELADSFASNGIIEPLVARLAGDHYEIVCGARRWRAAAIAQLATVPVIVKSLTDAQALEIMVIENNQREDVSALEEAEGFKQLLATGYDLEKLAERIGRSKKYVYDRLKLLGLIPSAKKLLEDQRINAGHAILIARLSPGDQLRVIDPNIYDGLFSDSDADEERPSKENPYAGKRVLSVREFEAWIDDNVRIDLAKPVEAEQFPELARLQQDKALRVASITHEYFLEEALQKGKAAGDRIYLAREWKRADGTKGTDPRAGGRTTFLECPRSLLGVVVVGRARGTAFNVCVDQACDIHWKKERASAPQRGGSGVSAAEKARQSAEQKKWAEQREREEADRKAYRAGAKDILAAFGAKVKDAKFGVIAAAIESHLQLHPKALAILGKPKAAEDLVRVLALSAVADALFEEWSAPRQVPKFATRLGVNLKPLLKAEPPAVQTSAQKSKAKKKR
jgi:ParB/RepB/Spo0J family partition protein